MALSDQLQADLTAAMKARDADTTATLRMVVAGIRNLRVAEGRGGSDVTDAEATDLLAREAKKRREAASTFRDAGREELAAKEERELAVIQRYLPQALSGQELGTIVAEAVAATGASGMGDLGKVMGAVMPRVKGRADGAEVQRLVRDALAG